jgi:Type II CAAX prenyl endopeptidase Rce1-like
MFKRISEIKDFKIVLIITFFVLTHTFYSIFLIVTSNSLTKEMMIPPDNVFPAILNTAWGRYLFVNFSIVILAPIFEEILFRSWIKLRFQNILVITVFGLFIYNSITTFYSLGYTQWKLNQPFNFVKDFLVYNISPAIDPIIQSFPAAFHTFRVTPVIFLFILGINLILNSFNVSLGKFLRTVFSKININLILILNGILFFLMHKINWENGINLQTWIFFIPFCLCFPFIAYRFGLKASIILHIFSNFIVNYLNISDFSFFESILYNSFYIFTTTTLIYLFMREIQIGLIREKLEITQSQITI